MPCLLPDTENCGLRIRRECWEHFVLHLLQRKLLVSDPGMHHGTCVTYVPWCMLEFLTRCGEDNVPAIPGACANCNFANLVRSPFLNARWTLFKGRIIWGTTEIHWLVLNKTTSERSLTCEQVSIESHIKSVLFLYSKSRPRYRFVVGTLASMTTSQLLNFVKPISNHFSLIFGKGVYYINILITGSAYSFYNIVWI